MVAAIIPAAGCSRRMRFPKPLLERAGCCLVEASCEALAVHFDPVVLVVGWCGTAVARRAPRDTVVVRARAWWRGSQIDSVRAGLLALPPGPVLVHPIDVPVPSQALLARLAGEIGQLRWAITGRGGIVSRRKVRDMLQPRWTCSWERARRELGYRESVGLEEGMRQTVEWYIRQGWLAER